VQTRYFVNGNHNKIICDLRPLSNICDRKKVGTEKVIFKNLNFKFQIPFPLELHILRKALVIFYTIKYDDIMILYIIICHTIQSPVANLLHLLPYKIVKIFYGKLF